MDQKTPRISRPLTETEQIENMLNLGDISEITPQPNEQAMQRIRRLELDLQEAKRDIEVRDKQIENLKKTQKHLQNHQELQRRRISTLEDRNRAQEAQLRRFREAQSVIVSDAVDSSLQQDKIKELRKENEQFKKEIARLTQEAQRKDDLLTLNQREIDQCREENQELKIKLRQSQAKFNKKAIELEGKITANKKVEVKTEVIVDTKEVERFQDLYERQKTERTKINAQLIYLKKQLDEAEKECISLRKERVQANEAKKTLRQKVIELQVALRKTKEMNKQSTIEKSDTLKEVVMGEGSDNDEQNETNYLEDKQVKKSLLFLFKQSSTNESNRVRILNSIIANAENELDALMAKGYQN